MISGDTSISTLAEALRRAVALIEGEPAAAVTVLRRLAGSSPRDLAVLRLLGRALRASGDEAGARAAEGDAIRISAATPLLSAAIGYMVAQRVPQAEALIRQQLARDPDDVTAICLLADIANRVGIYTQAEAL